MLAAIYARKSTEQTGVSDESRKSDRQCRSPAPLPPLPRRHRLRISSQASVSLSRFAC